MCADGGLPIRIPDYAWIDQMQIREAGGCAVSWETTWVNVGRGSCIVMSARKESRQLLAIDKYGLSLTLDL
jgi:hypothetical protein